MMTAKATVALLLAYVLALAAGTTSGLLVDRMHAAMPGQAGAKTPLAEQLQLSADQVVQMRMIWERTSSDLDGFFRRAQAIQRDRDEALVQLLTDDQREKFGIMDKEFAKRFADLKEEREAVFRDALAQTEGMLNDWQRAKYEELVRGRIGHYPSQQDSPTTEPSVNDLRP
jgi:Spy/CpxP family protein refolding chaperone